MGSAFMISAIGWRDALTVLRVIVLVVLVPLVLLIGQPPSRTTTAAINSPPSPEELPSTLPTNLVVIWMGTAVVFCCIRMSVPLIHLVPLAQDRGISLDDAPSVSFVMLVAGIFGRVAFGRLADLIGTIRAYWLASLWQTLLVVVFLRMEGLEAFDAYIETRGLEYDKAVACLAKDREALLAFYDFPAEHWTHPRTSNPIESTFATVLHQTVRSTGCLSNKTALAMVFEPAQAAEKSWRRLDGHNRLPKLIQGVEFTDGIEAVRQQPRATARTPPSPRSGHGSRAILRARNSELPNDVIFACGE